MTESIDIYKRFIECQMRCAEKMAQKNEEAGKKPFVTISRQTGAGGITISNCLVAYLRDHDQEATCPWTVFDQRIVDRVLEEHHLAKEIGKYMPENRTAETEDIVETLFELHPPAFALVHRTSETILHLAQLGNTVLVGRGANVITCSLSGGFHVRLIGAIKRRIKHAANYYHLSQEDAAKKVKEDDRGRRDYLKQNFGKDIDDPLLYDLVINTDGLSYPVVAKLIGDTVLRSWEIHNVLKASKQQYQKMEV